jgi:hypothetical protein
MVKVKITAGVWKDQEGEYVRDEGSAVVVRMPGNRIVEFAPERVEVIVDESEKAEAE